MHWFDQYNEQFTCWYDLGSDAEFVWLYTCDGYTWNIGADISGEATRGWHYETLPASIDNSQDHCDYIALDFQFYSYVNSYPYYEGVYVDDLYLFGTLKSTCSLSGRFVWDDSLLGLGSPVQCAQVTLLAPLRNPWAHSTILAHGL